MKTSVTVEKQPLEQERQTYERHKTELLAVSRGKYVVIRAQEIIGLYDTETEAFTEGYRRLGKGPFLVREVAAVDKTYTISASLSNVFLGAGYSSLTEDLVASNPPYNP